MTDEQTGANSSGSAPPLEIGDLQPVFVGSFSSGGAFAKAGLLISVGLHACLFGAFASWRGESEPAPAFLEIPVEIVTEAPDEEHEPGPPAEARDAQEAAPAEAQASIDPPPLAPDITQPPPPHDQPREAEVVEPLTPPPAPAPPRVAALPPAAEAEPPSVETSPPPAPRRADAHAMSRFVLKLRQVIERHKRFPDAVSDEGSAVVTFSVDRAGHVSDLALARSTGHAALDRAALDMIRRAEPLPPIPHELEQDTLTVTLPVNFVRKRRVKS